MAVTETVRNYVRLLDLPWNVSVQGISAGLDISAPELASSLRRAGVPVQAYQLVACRPNRLEFPFLGEVCGEWALECPQAGASRQGDATSCSSFRTIVGEPPVGVCFSLVHDRTGAQGEKMPDVALFYGSTGDPGSLADEQFCPDAAELISQAESRGRRVVFMDALGLIPEAAVNSLAASQGGKKRAFDAAFRQIAAETASLGKGGLGPVETRSPLWAAAYKFLGNQGIKGVVENLRFDLWEKIVAFDRRNLARHALEHFAAGLVDDAADLMVEQIRGFHELNCVVRNAHLAEQMKAICAECATPPLFLVLKEIGHFGVLESLLGDVLCVRSKILGRERFLALSRAAGMEPLLANIGVRLSQEETRAQALRSCLKMLILPRWQPTPSLRSSTRLLESTSVDHLSLEAIVDIVGELHCPTRIYLRNAPHTQTLQMQLTYLLRERGVLPSKAVVDPVTSLTFGGENDGSRPTA